MPRLAIGQAVVTDPSSGRASGYVLVAASPAVRPEDAHHLTAAPQVSDYLHLEESPGPFFSFYRLPSGAWAAVKRFVRGTRRGAYNRVVVHTLVVPGEVLRELACEPWLLWTRCRFRDRQGEVSPAALTERVGEPGLDRLDDLEVALDGEARAARAALLEKRRDFLHRRWGEDELAERLRRLLAALASGQRVLLPQDAEAEQLLTVAWSLLPAEDRVETPWTTHLTRGAGRLFHLACGPDPKAMAAEQDDARRWVLPLAEPVADDEGEDGRALARALTGAEVDLAALDDGFARYRIRLARGGQTRRWIAWLASGGARLAAGFDGAAELARLFHQLRLRPGERRSDPWLSPARFLGCAARTVARMLDAGQPADEAVAEVLEVLAATHWRDALLAPEVIAELEAEDVPAAVAFSLRGLREPPAGRQDRETLLDLVPWSRQHPLLGEVAVELATGLALGDSPRSAEAFGRAAAALAHRPKAEVGERLGTVLEALRRALAENRPSDGFRVFLRDMRAGVAAHPEKTLAVMAKLDGIPSADFLRWGETVALVAAELDDAAPEAASALRANYWRTLAARRWERFPASALEMLPGLMGDDRRRIAELWLPMIVRLENRPGERELVSALGSLVEPRSAEQKFHYNVGRLALAQRLGELDLEGVVAQAGRLLATNGTSAAYVRRAVRKLLPPQPEARAEAVLRLLLSPRILPSVKRVIETDLSEVSLKQVGARLPHLLPRLGVLASRGPLLLRVASRLGDQWRGAPGKAEAFLRQACRLARFDAVAAFLRSSERGKASFLLRAAAEGDAGLVRKISRAADDFPFARLYLRPYLETLREARSVRRRR